MSSDSIRSEISRLKGRQADLLKTLAGEEKIAADARADANKKRQAASRTKSSSMQRSNLSAADRAEAKAVAAAKKIGGISKDLASLDKRLAVKQRSLNSAEKSEQRTRDNQVASRRRKEIAHARQIAQLSMPHIQFVRVQDPKPEKLRVLYLTANPESTEFERTEADRSIVREGVWLRVDREVRSVQKKAVRGSNYRDLVELKHMPAATPQDVLEGLNDFRPHIIHFSGHGGGHALLMENETAHVDAGALIEFSLLGTALAATTTPPTLVVLNACETLEGAEILLNASPIIIAMSEGISDDAAIVFAKQFYAAIASAQSVGKALDQGRVALRMAELGEDHLPEIVTRKDVNVESLVLVKPHLDA